MIDYLKNKWASYKFNRLNMDDDVREIFLTIGKEMMRHVNRYEAEDKDVFRFLLKRHVVGCRKERGVSVLGEDKDDFFKTPKDRERVEAILVENKLIEIWFGTFYPEFSSENKVRPFCAVSNAAGWQSEYWRLTDFGKRIIWKLSCKD